MATESSSIRDGDLREALRRRPLRHANEFVIKGFYACATVSLATTASSSRIVGGDSLLLPASVARRFLPDTNWQPLFKPETFGIWELVAGTANVVLWSLALAVPVGLATAMYLSEYAAQRTRRILKPVLEALASVPTVVYAYFALNFVTLDVLRPVLGPDLPIFNALSASVLLAVMILPTIASISEDAMASVPRDLREAAYGLGATRFEVSVRVVVPAALSGIIASVLLAIARVVGETMIVAIAAGSTPNLTLWPLSTIQTMTGYMLQVGLGDAARGTVQYQSLFAVGSTLFVITLLFNIGATWFVNRFREEYQ